MQKILKFLWIVAALFVLTACSGGASYSAEKCQALEEKIKSGQELTDGDYTEMIDQLQAIVDIIKEKEKEIGEDEEKKNEFLKSPEAKTYVGNILGFGIYLDSHADQLSEANKRKLNKVMTEFENEKKGK